MSNINNPYKLQIASATIDFTRGTVECRCAAVAQSYFGNFMIDQPIFLSEVEDLGDNPSWTNDDLKQAIANKVGLSVDEIKFM